jgi:uncharacterized membrane protein YhaH (DUF805 family)
MALMFEPLRKYARFTGRARRLEYWSFQLLMAAVFGILYIWFGYTLPPGPYSVSQDWFADAIATVPASRIPAAAMGFASLFFLIPSLAVSVRRLHDSDRSGWWILLGLTGIGSLVLLVFYLLDGTRGANRHGADPKGRDVQS